MTIAAVATETKATLLIAELRRCLSVGDVLKGKYLQWALDQLLNASVTDTSARTDVSPDNLVDGRNEAEAAAVA